MPQKKGRRKKRRTHVVQDEAEDDKKIPRSLVIRRGEISPSMQNLELDLRRMLMPHTALHLRERKRGKMKDYLSVAGKLGVSHFWLLSTTESAGYLRVCKFPQGPTLRFRLRSYSLVRDVRVAQRRPVSLEPMDLRDPPLLVLNNFSAGKDHVKVMATIFENMFPRLDVKKVVLSTVKRVILIDFDASTGLVHMRHYKINAVISGLSKAVKAVVVKHKVPDLAGLTDIAQIADEGAAGIASSDSEGEGGEETQVLLPQNLGRNKRKGGKTSIRLREVGPRLTLELVKIEDGFCDGAVFYHAHISRTEEEVEQLQKKHELRRMEKARRRAEQEENVRRKEAAKAARRGKRPPSEDPDAEPGDGDAEAEDEDAQLEDPDEAEPRPKKRGRSRDEPASGKKSSKGSKSAKKRRA